MRPEYTTDSLASPYCSPSPLAPHDRSSAPEFMTGVVHQQSPLGEDPPLCECAHFGKRPLSWAVWLGRLSMAPQGSVLDRKNLEFSHEHIRFGQTGQDIGFGPDGLFSENTATYAYRWDPTCYDGSLVRKAIRTVTDLGSYGFLKNNCQDFVAKVQKFYFDFTRAR